MDCQWWLILIENIFRPARVKARAKELDNKLIEDLGFSRIVLEMNWQLAFVQQSNNSREEIRIKKSYFSVRYFSKILIYPTKNQNYLNIWIMNTENVTIDWPTYTDHVREMLNEMLLSNDFMDVTLVWTWLYKRHERYEATLC